MKQRRCESDKIKERLIRIVADLTPCVVRENHAKPFQFVREDVNYASGVLTDVRCKNIAGVAQLAEH